MLRTPFDLRQLLTPGGAIPDLEVVVDSGDDDVPAELRVPDQRGRTHQPALLVELRLRRAGEEEPVEPAPLLAERIQRGELRVDESIPIRTTVGVEAPVEPARDDDPLGEGFPELGRKGETVLVIDRVLVLAEEHRLGRLLSFPLRPTLSHFPPQRKPKRGIFAPLQAQLALIASAACEDGGSAARGEIDRLGRRAALAEGEGEAS